MIFETARQLFLLQLITRLASFALNILLIGISHPQTIGLVSLSFETLLSTILFLSREPTRNSIHRIPSNLPLNSRFKLLLNASVISVNLGLLLSLVCYFLKDKIWVGREYSETVDLYLIAAIFEVIGEPFYLLLTGFLMVDVRVRIEGFAFIIRCLSTFIMTVYIGSSTQSNTVDISTGVYIFGLSQVLFSLTLIVSYISHFAFSFKTVNKKKYDNQISDFSFAWFIPSFVSIPDTATIVNENINKSKKHKTKTLPTNKSIFISPQITKIIPSFLLQSLLKHLLTEGDKFLLTLLSVPSLLGPYAFANNLGSLVARILFQPLEETMRIFYAGNRSIEGMELMSIACKAHVLFGCFFVFFGTQYTGVVVDVLGGTKWSGSGAVEVLGAFCFYVPVMGINGITEAFVMGVADQNTLKNQSIFMVFCSLLFVSTTFIAVNIAGLGGIGFVIGNIANLSARICFSIFFIQSFFDKKLRFKVEKSVLTGFLISFIVLRISLSVFGWKGWKAKGAHVSVGVVVFVFMLLLMYYNFIFNCM